MTNGAFIAWTPDALDAELQFAAQRGRMNWSGSVNEALQALGVTTEGQTIPWDVWRQSAWYGPIDPWMRPPSQISDLCIDPHGDVRIRELSGRIFTETGMRISRAWVDWVQAVIAIRAGIAACESPLEWRAGDGRVLLAVHGSYNRRFRFAMTRTPYTPDGPTLAVRMLPSKWMTLEDLVVSRVLTHEAAEFLVHAMKRGGTLLISGVTASGKTTIAGALLIEASSLLNRRIIQIEDACELPAPTHGFSVEVLRSGMSFSECVRMALRQNPDMIVLGEVRGPEALAMLQAAATGHPGVATIHADRALAGLINLERMAASDPNADAAFVRSMLAGGSARMIALHIGSDGGQRRILEIIEPLAVQGTSPGEPLPYNIIFQYDAPSDRLVFRFPPTGEWLR